MLAVSRMFYWLGGKAVSRSRTIARALRPLADIMKLLARQDIEPTKAHKLLFESVLMLILAVPLSALFLIPMIDVEAFIHFEGDLVFIVLIMCLLAVLALLGGQRSKGRVGLPRGGRAVMESIGYEVPLAIALIGPAIVARSFSVTGIVEWQATQGLWIMPLTPIGFAVAIVAILTQLGTTDVSFEVSETETETVSGWQAELSGRRLALTKLATNLHQIVASCLIGSLFLGGSSGPTPLIPGVIWFLVKTTIVMLALSKIRTLFARFRIAQTMSWSWRHLVPPGIVQIVFLLLLM